MGQIGQIIFSLTTIGILSRQIVSALSNGPTSCPSKAPSSWITLAEKVCYRSKSDNFTKFTIDRNSTLVAIRLLHISGNLFCYTPGKAKESYWGCSSTTITRCSNIPCMSTLITNELNEIILPTEKKVDPSGFYDLDGFGHKDDVIILKPAWMSMKVYTGQSFRIWYGPDLKNINNERNGEGEHCVQVDASFY